MGQRFSKIGFYNQGPAFSLIGFRDNLGLKGLRFGWVGFRDCGPVHRLNRLRRALLPLSYAPPGPSLRVPSVFFGCSSKHHLPEKKIILLEINF